jgi:hypothetical protein
MKKFTLLTRMIFDYWKTHMTCPVESIEWAQSREDDWFVDDQYGIRQAEGLFWYDGYNSTFWYMLNMSWYKMNNKLYANTFNNQPFDPYIGDFDEDYIMEEYGC